MFEIESHFVPWGVVGQKSLSRDFCCGSCPGTKGQWDKETFFVLSQIFPSLGNPNSQCLQHYTVKIIYRCLLEIVVFGESIQNSVYFIDSTVMGILIMKVLVGSKLKANSSRFTPGLIAFQLWLETVTSISGRIYHNLKHLVVEYLVFVSSCSFKMREKYTN